MKGRGTEAGSQKSEARSQKSGGRKQTAGGSRGEPEFGMTSLGRIIAGIALVACPGLQPYSNAKAKSCPAIARLPADVKDTEPPDYREWFELRLCGDGTVVVECYEPHRTTPSMAFDTEYPYPVQLVHMQNVLVLESPGGTANHVFVFVFEKGKPKVALDRSTAGGVKVMPADHGVEVKVPPKTYPELGGGTPAYPKQDLPV